MKGTRDLRVDNVRGVLIFLVVAGHFLLPVNGERLTMNLMYLIYSFHMPCFMLVSGYLSHGIYTRERGFRWDRWVQLLWLFILFKLMVNVTEGMLAGQIRPVPDFFHESGAPWYLLVLMGYYLLVPLFYLLRRWRILVLAALSLACAASGYLPFLSDLLAMDRFFAFAVFFFLGYYIRKEDADRFFASPIRRIVQAAALLLGLGAVCLTYDFLQPYTLVVYGAAYGRFPEPVQPFCFLLALFWQAGATLLSLGLAASLPAARIPLFTTLGQRTLQVYMLHRPIRDLWQYFGLAALVNARSAWSVTGLMLGSFLLTLVLGCGPIAVLFAWIRNLPQALAARIFPQKERNRL